MDEAASLADELERSFPTTRGRLQSTNVLEAHYERETGPAEAMGGRTLLRIISRNRRLWKDAEATESATAFLYAAAVMILVRRIARHS